MSNDFELLGRLLLAAVLGGTIGAERELNDQAAGLRTHMLLTIGACLFTRPASGRPPRSGSRSGPAATCSVSAEPCWWSAPCSGLRRVSGVLQR